MFKICPSAGGFGTAKRVGKTPLYDAVSGGCRDGLGPNGANPNQGGEATVSYVIAHREIQSRHGIQTLRPARRP
jgi:hypothetical protein